MHKLKFMNLIHKNYTYMYLFMEALFLDYWEFTLDEKEKESIILEVNCNCDTVEKRIQTSNKLIIHQ